MPVAIGYSDLGLAEYAGCWRFQRELSARVAGGEEAGRLIMCEHPHVYTLGRSGRHENLLVDAEFLQKIGAAFHHIDRGGDITYHGPGQLVGYPILDLRRLGIGIKEYIHTLEQSIIDTLEAMDIIAGRREGAAGVWLGAEAGRPLRKIAAIGVHASRGITMHGFALNVATDLNYFTYINPCGLAEREVTSMGRELERRVDMEEVKKVYAAMFARLFGVVFERGGAADNERPPGVRNRET